MVVNHVARFFKKSMNRFGIIGVTAGAVLVAVATPAFAATSFTAGDLVIYETVGISSASSAVNLVDYGVSSTTVSGTTTASPGFSVALPTADNSGTNTHALTESGSAVNDGELTLSADGTELLATGYDSPTGVLSITKAASLPRTVDIVTQTGTVDSSTSLTDAQTEGSSASPNNFRSATQASAGTNIYTAGDGGLGVTTDGGTSASPYLTTTDNLHDVVIEKGNLYDSTTANINEVGTGGLPASGSTPADEPLLSGTTNLPGGFDPDQFAFVNLGPGSGPDTLYVADNGNQAVDKFSLISGVWTLKGSIAVPEAAGLVADVVTVSGVKEANVFVTGSLTATGSGDKNNTVLYGITDASGAGNTLTGSFTKLATAPTGDDFHGLAFAPGTSIPNNGDTPEVPLAILLPVAAGLVLGGGVFVARRRRSGSPAAAS
jgi:hypothetical protein